MADFLLEIGLEEVPARMLAAAEAALRDGVVSLLQRERLLPADGGLKSYSTPRRLAVLVSDVSETQPDSDEQLMGPAVSVAYKDGAPTAAAHAFAKKAGVTLERLEQVTTARGLYLSARVARAGRAATEVLAERLPGEIAALAWPKTMYWRPGKPERFVRPVKWLVALLDREVVPVVFAGVRAGAESSGHRILFGSRPVPVTTPEQYRSTLEHAKVRVDADARRHSIRKALDRVTRSVAGARWREDERLVETVTHMTEWPTVLLGSFSPGFLVLPEEVLVTVMRDHQNYFAVEDANGKLAPYFLTVLNTEADAAAEAIIRHGNERVLRARFSDAQFFWTFDQRVPLAERVGMLEKVTFQKDLGNYAQKTERTRGIAHALAQQVIARGRTIRSAALERAVTLSKTDLTTELVKEFTELQGVVGGLYARAQAEPADDDCETVAQAIYWQYMPATVTDAVPPTPEGQLLGIADRMGTIVDLFGIDLAPTGSRDPYALRRAANAVVRILCAGGLPLAMSDLLAATGGDEAVLANVRAFFEERVSFYLREVESLRADVVAAVLRADSDNMQDAQARGRALEQVLGSEDLAAISAAWKRSKNILRQAGHSVDAGSSAVDTALLQDGAERGLWLAVAALVPEVEALRTSGAYVAALERIARMRPQVDAFFDNVMVMAEDPALRQNRLALLSKIVRELGRIADFSELAPAGAER